MASTYTVLPNKDTYVDEANATTNYYGAADLTISTTSGGRKRVLLQFPMPTIPATEEIKSVAIRLWVKDGAGAPVDAFRITGDWASNAVTWNAQPTFGSTVRGTFSPTTSGAFAELDITPLVRSWIAGSLTNNGVALVPQSGTSSAVFQSQNGTPDTQDPVLIFTTVTKPQLELTISTQVVSDPFNGTSNPKRVPGAVIDEMLTLTNKSAGGSDPGTLDVRRPVPPGTSLFVGDLLAPGYGPIACADGIPSSGLTYTFSGLASTTDSLSFSNDNGASFAYAPTPDVSGYDQAVTNIRITPGGAMAGAGAGGAPSVACTMRLRER